MGGTWSRLLVTGQLPVHAALNSHTPFFIAQFTFWSTIIGIKTVLTVNITSSRSKPKRNRPNVMWTSLHLFSYLHDIVSIYVWTKPSDRPQDTCIIHCLVSKWTYQNLKHYKLLSKTGPINNPNFHSIQETIIIWAS